MKIFFKLFITILFLIFITLTYLSIFGIETDKFNSQITEKIRKFDKNLEVELKEIKLILDPFQFKLQAKTIGTNLINQSKKIEIENIKTQLSLKSLIEDKFSIENLEISSKSLELKNLISFLRSFQNSPELFILEKAIKKGYLITDIKLEFDSNGNIKKTGIYILNEKNKEWKYFYEDGSIQQKGNFVKNKPHGTWEWWYESGQKRRTENYENGKEKGFVFEYDTTGKVIVKGEFFYGLREGVWSYEINDYQEKGSYIGGMKTGKWKKTYISTNKDKFKGEYLNDIPIGKHIYYYPNGQIKTEGKYKNGEKEGEWIYYNELGDIIITYLYKDGREFKRDGVKVKY